MQISSHCPFFFDNDGFLRGNLAVAKIGAFGACAGTTILISGHNSYNPTLAFAEWPDKKGFLYLEKEEYELIHTHRQTQQ
jgi:hypothetical protein